MIPLLGSAREAGLDSQSRAGHDADARINGPAVTYLKKASISAISVACGKSDLAEVIVQLDRRPVRRA